MLIWLSWIDDCLCVGHPDAVDRYRNNMKRLFDCDDVGDTEEYLECNIDRENRSLKFTQPVMVQGFKDEFEMLNHVAITPGEPVTTLVKVEEELKLPHKRTTYFRLGVGKLLHMMRCSCLEI